MAAGLLMITEAGGTVTDADGGAEPLITGSVCAANSDLHPKLLARLHAAN
jgi:myo-inositol-1(or 4)-monophosphatase